MYRRACLNMIAGSERESPRSPINERTVCEVRSARVFHMVRVNRSLKNPRRARGDARSRDVQYRYIPLNEACAPRRLASRRQEGGKEREVETTVDGQTVDEAHEKILPCTS